MLIPYIGITGFTGFKQVLKMLDVFTLHQTASQRMLHVGVMMNHRTLYGPPGQRPSTYPPKEAIDDIFASDETYNCPHYVEFGYDPDLRINLAKAIAYGGIGIHALQLDMAWPDPAEIASAVHASRKYIEVILQIDEKALARAHNDPLVVVEKLRDYEGVIHRVLLDKSMGRGVVIKPDELLPFTRAIRDNFPELGLGWAGALGPKTMPLVEPHLKEFPDLSFDAQSGVTASGNSLDPIDLEKAEAYLIEALALFK